MAWLVVGIGSLKFPTAILGASWQEKTISETIEGIRELPKNVRETISNWNELPPEEKSYRLTIAGLIVYGGYRAAKAGVSKLKGLTAPKEPVLSPENLSAPQAPTPPPKTPTTPQVPTAPSEPTAAKIPGGSGGKSTSAPKQIFGEPHARHTATRVKQGTVAKNLNTVIEPGVDVAGDVAAINAGKATRVKGNWVVNGRTYGVEEGGRLFPIEGSGFHQLSRGAFKALGVFNKFGNTPRAAEILSLMKATEADKAAALRVWEVTRR